MNILGTGTSTFANGLNITTGCYSVAGACLSTVAGTDGQIQYNNSNAMGGASNFVYDDTNTRIGIGTSTPGTLFSLASLTTNTNASFLLSGINMVYASSSTTTIPTGLVNAWSISTSTTITPFLSIDSNSGNVGIGTANFAAPAAGRLNVDVAVSRTTPTPSLILRDSSSLAANTGGLLTFTGVYTGTTQTWFAGIQGGKENATDGNYAGYLRFFTRVAGSNDSMADAADEVMRITSAGNVGIGTTSPAALFSVSGTGYFSSSVGIGISSPAVNRVLHAEGPAVRFQRTDEGFVLELERIDATPVATDQLGAIEFRGPDDTQDVMAYASISGNSDSVTNTSESGSIKFTTLRTGSSASRLIIGAGLEVGSATGGDKGAGTINVGTDIYKNNTAYANPDYVFEKYYTGQIVLHADKLGAKEYPGFRPISETEEYVKTNYRLPMMSLFPEGGLFDRGDLLLASLEESYLYLFDHEKRLKQLEEASTTIAKLTLTDPTNALPAQAGWSVDQMSGKVNVTFFGTLNLNGNEIINVSKILGMDGKWSIDENGKLVAESVTTKKLCLDELCITKEELKTILQNAGIIGADAESTSAGTEIATSTENISTPADIETETATSTETSAELLPAEENSATTTATSTAP